MNFCFWQVSSFFFNFTIYDTSVTYHTIHRMNKSSKIIVMNSLDNKQDSRRSSILSNYSLIVLNQKFQAYLQNRRTKEELYTLRLQYFTAFVLILIILSIIFMFIYALTNCDFKQTDIDIDSDLDISLYMCIESNDRRMSTNNL